MKTEPDFGESCHHTRVDDSRAAPEKALARDCREDWQSQNAAS